MKLLELQDEEYPPVKHNEEQAYVESLIKLYGDRGMTIRYDEGTKTIHIGKWSTDKFHNFKSFATFVEVIMAGNGISLSKHPKYRSIGAAAMLKRTPKSAYAHYKKLQYKKFVMPYKHLLTKIAFSPGRIANMALKHIAKNAHVLQPVYEDKLYNLLPIVAITGKSPQQLKKELGQAWKVLSKNSLNKNSTLIRSGGGGWNCNFNLNEEDLVERAELPTTVLKRFSGHRIDTLKHIAKHYRGQWSKTVGKSPDWSTVNYQITDTKNMAEKLGLPFDPLWSPRKLKEKHDEYAKKVNALRYSPDKIGWLKELPHTFTHENYTAVLLDNRQAIAEEGAAMGHCVGGYAESVASGNYLVYSIRKGGERSSTLGIHVIPPQRVEHTVLGQLERHHIVVNTTKFRYNQHYGRFNKNLECEHEKEIGRLIIEELNKEKKDGI